MFECHRNSYLTELSATVLSCEKSVHTINGKNVDGFNVVLTDTVLFPEEGGQPDDRGIIDGKPVLKVNKVNNEAVHFVESVEPLPVGKCVQMKVDWKRRWDHMQQHTAQHLISAVARDDFNLLTTSWTLGDTDSYIEIDAPHVENDIVKKLDAVLNEKIKDGIAVKVELYNKNDPEFSKVRSRCEIPDETDQMRVININGVDRSTCNGTHVSNLSHLRTIKLLSEHQDDMLKMKKNKFHLYFVAGERLLLYLGKCVKQKNSETAFLKGELIREISLMNLLQNGHIDYNAQIRKIQEILKDTAGTEGKRLELVRDNAVLEAKIFKQMYPKPMFYSLHREDGVTDFAKIFANEVDVQRSETLFLVTVMEKESSISPVYVLMFGNQKHFNTCVPIAETLLNAKNVSQRYDHFKAKVPSFANISKLEERLKRMLISD